MFALLKPPCGSTRFRHLFLSGCDGHRGFLDVDLAPLSRRSDQSYANTNKETAFNITPSRFTIVNIWTTLDGTELSAGPISRCWCA